MSNRFQGLRTVVYMMPDLKAATQWYTDILGIEPYFNTPYYVGFNVGGFELGLHPKADETTTGDNVFAYWGVEDVNATIEQLIKAGAIEHEKPTDVGDGIILAAIKDPWGNVFGVINNPHFKLS